MRFNPLDFRTSVRINNDKIVSASKGYLTTIYWNGTGYCCKLYLIFSWEKIDPVHDGWVENAGDHLGLVHYYLLQISPSKRALVEDGVGKVGLGEDAVVEVHVGEDIAHFVQEGDCIWACLW
jgi:hypothetical protein